MRVHRFFPLRAGLLELGVDAGRLRDSLVLLRPQSVEPVRLDDERIAGLRQRPRVYLGQDLIAVVVGVERGGLGVACPGFGGPGGEGDLSFCDERAPFVRGGAGRVGTKGGGCEGAVRTSRAMLHSGRVRRNLARGPSASPSSIPRRPPWPTRTAVIEAGCPKVKSSRCRETDFPRRCFAFSSAHLPHSPLSSESTA